MANPEAALSKIRKMGVGTAIRRLVDLEFALRIYGGVSKDLNSERELLLEALDFLEIELGFDCDRDGIPDQVGEILRESASTGCCILIPIPSKTTQRASPGRGTPPLKDTSVAVAVPVKSTTRRKIKRPPGGSSIKK